MARDLYDVARQVTDEVLGEGTYLSLNTGNPDPGVQAAIRRVAEERQGESTLSTDEVLSMLGDAPKAEPVRYRLTYDSGAGITVWEKTLEELLVPNGDESLLVWMLRESEAQGRGTFVLERITDG